MKQLIAVLVIAFSLAACSHDKKDVLSEAKMAKVLLDIHMIDGTLNTYRYSMNTFENTDSMYLYKMAFERNKVSRQEFIKSMEYYSRYPKKMDRIYAEVINEISAQEQSLRESLRAQQKADSTHRSDSLKRVGAKDPTKPSRIVNSQDSPLR